MRDGLLDRFALIRERGAETGYRVYEARDKKIGRTLELRVFDRSPRGARERARVVTIAALSSPSFAAVFDVGDVGGVSYAALEATRSRRIQSFIDGGHSAPLRSRLAWIRALASAFDAADQSGLLHVGALPKDIAALPSGEVKILAVTPAPPRENGAGVDRSATTRTLQIVRSVDDDERWLMSPEVLGGSVCTPAAAQYAWGVLSSALLAPANAFRRAGHFPDATLLKSILRASEPASNIPAAARAVLLRALNDDPFERFSCFADLLTALREIGAQAAPVTRRLRLGVAVGAVAIAAVSFSARHVDRLSVRRHQQRREAKSEQPVWPNPQAAAAFAAGMQALRDASKTQALASFASAARIDPAFGDAHLWWVISLGYYEDRAKEHFAAAVTHRARLSETNRDILNALEPWTNTPPDVPEALRRLDELARAKPNDATVLFTRIRYLHQAVHDEEVIRHANELLAVDPSFAYARFLKGMSEVRLGRTNEAISSWRNCVDVSPSATSCLDMLSRLYMNEGRGEEMVVLTRRLIARDPENAEWYRRLAEGVFCTTQSTDAARAALDAARQKIQVYGPSAEISALAARANLDVLAGHFDDSKDVLDEWHRVVSTSPNRGDHFDETRVRVQLLSELNRIEDAKRVIDDYLDSVPGWVHDDFDSDDSFFILQFKYHLGLIDSASFAAARDAWARSDAVRPSSERPLTWTRAYAGSARTSQDAVAAIARLHDFGLPDPLTRSTPHDLAIGRTYALSGDRANAIVFLTRAANACSALQRPYEHTEANLEVAAQLIQAGDLQLACRHLATVLRRWGRERRSRTATRARVMADKLRCPQE